MSTRTSPCDQTTKSGRVKKAYQFLEAAETIRDVADDEVEIGDAFVTLCVHAGIAAADAICCEALGEYSRGQDHNEAVQLMKRVRPGGSELANALSALLGLKTRAEYSGQAVTADQQKRAERNARKLVEAARSRVT